MKKLIVFSVIFALLVSAVFAETSFGGGVGGQVKFAEGDTADTNDAHQPGGSSGIDIRLDVNAQNDDGTFGAYGKFWSGNDGNEPFGQVWWKPLDFLKVTVGFNRWGDFGSAEIVRWDFYQDAGDNGVVSNGTTWDWGHAFYAGFEAPGALLAFTPIDGLAINLVLPYNNGELRDVYKNFTAQVSYWLSGIGKIALTMEAGGLESKVGMWTWQTLHGFYATGPKFYAQFFLSALENSGLQVNIGAGFGFPANDEDVSPGTKVTMNNQVAVGLGVNFWSGDFGLKARVRAEFGGYETTEPKGGEATTVNDPFTLFFDILPSYNLGIFRFFFSAGITMTGKKQERVTDNGKLVVKDVDKSDTFGFHINPYIIKPVSTGGTFYAGFRLDTSNMINIPDGSKVTMNWSIPLALSFGF